MSSETSAGAPSLAGSARNAPIVRIALTHAHMDHVGSFDALHAALPDAETLVSARDARFLEGDRSLDPDEPQDKLRGGYVTTTTRPSRLLEAGDRVGSLEVIATPGHTPGHIAFFDTRDRTLIAGDALMTQGGIAVSGQLRLRCREPFLELPDVSWAFGQLPPNQGEFLLQERDLAGEIVGLFLPTCGA